jgi:hypothetical protein
MHDDLAAAGLDVAILGINQAGYESGNRLACQGRDIPWLQETVDAPVWSEWGITFRDVVILDGDNVVIGVYNLTEHDLQDPADYAELYAMFEAAASGP